MPFQIKKVGEKYKLQRIKDKTYVKQEYKSKQSALNAGMNFMRYRKEKPIVKGNKILAKKK